MSPSKREREYDRRRYAQWQERRETRAQRRRRLLQTGGVLGGVVLVLAVAVGLWWFVLRDDSPATVAEPAPSAGDTSSDGATTPGGTDDGTTDDGSDGTAPDSVPDPSVAEGREWTASLQTSVGEIGLTLDGADAPQAVANFVTLAGNGYFDGTPCHRLVTSGIYVLQCGDPTGSGTGGPGYSWGPIENAPADDVYPAGTLAMARVGNDAASMGSQFFVVYQDSQIPSDSAGGYTVFGQVTSGLDLVEEVAAAGNAADGVAPATEVVLEAVTAR